MTFATVVLFFVMWIFMNPPGWAVMLAAIVIMSTIPASAITAHFRR